MTSDKLKRIWSFLTLQPLYWTLLCRTVQGSSDLKLSALASREGHSFSFSVHENKIPSRSLARAHWSLERIMTGTFKLPAQNLIKSVCHDEDLSQGLWESNTCIGDWADPFFTVVHCTTCFGVNSLRNLVFILWFAVLYIARFLLALNYVISLLTLNILWLCVKVGTLGWKSRTR